MSGGLEAAIPPRNNSTLSFCGDAARRPDAAAISPLLSLSLSLGLLVTPWLYLMLPERQGRRVRRESILIPVYNLPTLWVCFFGGAKNSVSKDRPTYSPRTGTQEEECLSHLFGPRHENKEKSVS